jgi:hypothetical protein
MCTLYLCMVYYLYAHGVCYYLLKEFSKSVYWMKDDLYVSGHLIGMHLVILMESLSL